MVQQTPKTPRSARVVHVINGLPTGGAEMMLYKLLTHTDMERFDPVVVSLMDEGVLGPRIEALGIPVHTVGMRPGRPTPAAALRLLRLARRLKPDLVQGWMSQGNLAASLAGLAAPGRVPVVWNVRQSLYSMGYEKRSTAFVIRLCGRLSGLPAKILYNSATSAAHHEALGYRAEKTEVIPNGFDTELFVPSAATRSAVRSELGVGEDTPLIGLVGRYHPMKDHANFLRAARMLLKKRPDARFVLCGRDADRNNRTLTALISELGLAGRVYPLGERDDVPRLTAALDVASSTSYSEAFSNTVGEAMSCGVPCAVTDVGDSALIVADTGAVVPPRDPEALCAAWLELIEMPPEARRALGARARRRVEEHFAIGAVVRRYEKVYEERLVEA